MVYADGEFHDTWDTYTDAYHYIDDYVQQHGEIWSPGTFHGLHYENNMVNSSAILALKL